MMTIGSRTFGLETMTDMLQYAIGNLKQVQELIDAGYKALAKEAHPDKGGTAEQMERLNSVRDRLRTAAASMEWGSAFMAKVARAEARNARARTRRANRAKGRQKHTSAATSA